MDWSRKGRARASAQTMCEVCPRATDSSGQETSTPIVARLVPVAAAADIPCRGISAKPVPTSSSVASEPSAGRIRRSSATAARKPPSQRFERVMSPVERVRTPASTAGSSRISMPLRRAGVSTSALELGVSAAIVEQRTTVPRLGAIHLRDEDGMVATVVMRDETELEMGQRLVEKDGAALAARVGDAVEPLVVLVGEAARIRFLVGRQDA